jgi:ribosomal-protein-alanine N-acetyltransferase
VTLREPRASDAAALFAMVSTEEVARFITPPPNSRQDFERFIAWARAEREAGAFACFAIVPEGYDQPVGVFQIRRLEPSFSVAEWGFVMASQFWGSGLFLDGARRVVEFAFETIGVRRLEARAVLQNGRGNGALKKLGAVQEGILRQAFTKGGRYLDQSVWSILESDWQRSKAVWGPKIH